MTDPANKLTSSPAWLALQRHATHLRGQALRHLFAQDSDRAAQFQLSAAGLHLDYSKQRVTARTMQLLRELALARGLPQQVAALFAGEPVNRSENRPALHTALRTPQGQSIWVAGVDVVAQVHKTLARMTHFCEQIDSGQWHGHSGQRIRNIINIGTGGSHLGPAMACRALRTYSRPDLRIRFVSNVDPDDLGTVTSDLDATETLFIICSKSFTTQETLLNAQAARRWCTMQLGDERAVSRHFVAVSAAQDKAREFGLTPEQIFPMWDWVGGRYSLGSAAGLALMLAVGPAHFHDMLAGFHAMDVHFRHAPPEQNLPLTLGLLAVWNTNFMGTTNVAILPYAQALALWPAYLQQLAMESLGKSMTQDGAPVDYATGPVYWGQCGTNGQHSFYQLLHQGRHSTTCDFIGLAQAQEDPSPRHDILMAHMIAQSRALAFGEHAAAVHDTGVPNKLPPYRSCAGDHTSSTLLAARLTPRVLGALVAAYEHSVFTQGVIWNINPFDQWGVALGKRLAQQALDARTDGSTHALMRLRNER